jgi:TonB family protein
MPSKGLALVALALGLVGLFTGGLLGLGSLLGLLLAGLALYRASRQPQLYGGRDVAWAAVAANGFALATLLPLALSVTTLQPLLFPPDPGLPDPIPESQRFFDGGTGAAPVPPPPPPPPPPGSASAAPRAMGAASPATPTEGVAGRAAPPPATVPVRIGGRIREPRKLQHVSPAYPDIAKQARVQGIVILECVITAEGHVGKVTVLRGIPLLDEAAIEAVRQWRYAPTLLEGQPVPVIMTVTVNFRLD